MSLRSHLLTIPQALAQYVLEEPDRIIYSFDGNKGIRARELEQATKRAAKLLNKDTGTGIVVAIVALYDVLVIETTVIGLMAAGLVVRPWQIASIFPNNDLFTSLF